MESADYTKIQKAMNVINEIMTKYAQTAAGAGADKVVSKTKKVAKLAAGDEEKPAVKAAAKNTDGKREIAFGAKESHTISLKKGLGLPADKLDKEQNNNWTKSKASFKKYAESLADDDFDSKNLDEHVQDWLEIKDEPKAEEPKDNKPKPKGKGKPKEEHKAEAPVAPTILSLIELDGIKNELTEADKPGVYWHPSTGRHVTGPNVIPDEENDIEEMNGIDYQVYENTKRVYDVETEEFLGFAGFGKFKNLVVE